MSVIAIPGLVFFFVEISYSWWCLIFTQWKNSDRVTNLLWSKTFLLYLQEYQYLYLCPSFYHHVDTRNVGHIYYFAIWNGFLKKGDSLLFSGFTEAISLWWAPSGLCAGGWKKDSSTAKHQNGMEGCSTVKNMKYDPSKEQECFALKRLRKAPARRTCMKRTKNIVNAL